MDSGSGITAMSEGVVEAPKDSQGLVKPRYRRCLLGIHPDVVTSLGR